MAAAEGDYIEYEIRTGSTDNRQYYAANFTSNVNCTEKRTLPLSNTFTAPLYMRFDESETNQKNTTQTDQDMTVERTSFRTRRWRHDKEYCWKLYSEIKNEKECYTGNTTSRTLPYVVMIPPTDQTGSFKLFKVKEMVEFKPKIKYNVLNLEEAEQLINKNVKFGSTLMKKMMDKQENGNEIPKNTAVSSKKKNKNSFELDEEMVEQYAEDDVEALAIDRMAVDLNGETFADFEEAFEDDEDDRKEIEMVNDMFLDEKDAEEVQKIQEDEEEEESEDEEMDVETNKPSLETDKKTQNPQVEGVNADTEMTEEDVEKRKERMKFTESLLKGVKRKATPAPIQPIPVKKAKVVLNELELSLVGLLKSASGKMKTKDLVRAAKEKKLINDKIKFKAALSNIGALETVGGIKMVVLKANIGS